MKINSILVVCIGNICRSPIGEELLKISLGNSGIKVDSAGLEAVVGSKAHELSREVMNEHGYNLDSHIAKQITQPLVIQSDLILVMSNGQKRELEKRYPAVRGKVMRLGHWGNYDIADPLGKDKEVFKETYRLIEESVQSWIGKLQ